MGVTRGATFISPTLVGPDMEKLHVKLNRIDETTTTKAIKNRTTKPTNGKPAREDGTASEEELRRAAPRATKRRRTRGLSDDQSHESEEEMKQEKIESAIESMEGTTLRSGASVVASTIDIDSDYTELTEPESTTDEDGEAEAAPETARKRGRPRKTEEDVRRAEAKAKHAEKMDAERREIMNVLDVRQGATFTKEEKKRALQYTEQLEGYSTADIAARIEETMQTVYRIAKSAGNLKGTHVRALSDAAIFTSSAGGIMMQRTETTEGRVRRNEERMRMERWKDGNLWWLLVRWVCRE